MKIISNARAASDTRHRINYPNSRRRIIKLAGIGQGGARIVSKIGAMGLKDVHTVVPDRSSVATAASELQMLNGADMIFVVACAGDDLALAPLIKQIGRLDGVLVTGILIQRLVPKHSVHTRLEVLRAASDMLVIASDDSYVSDMLTELGA
jgi:cell division GTPase FtsZ